MGYHIEDPELRPPVSTMVLPLPLWREFRESLGPHLEHRRKNPYRPEEVTRLIAEERDDVLTITRWDNGRFTPWGSEWVVLVELPEPVENPSGDAGKEKSDSEQERRYYGFWPPDSDRLPSFWEFQGSRRKRLKLLAVDTSTEVYARIEGVFETRKLVGKTVSIFGVGSLGSFCAEELVRCGVDSFRLVDFDRLEPHNVVRHACDLRDLGRYKTRAVADLIWGVNPLATVECLEIDVLAEAEAARKVVEGSSIVLVCTDGNPSRFLLNELCLELGVPAVYGGAYERAFGGHVLRVIPGLTPCFECVIGGVLASLGTLPEPQKGRVAYLGAENQEDFVAEPGLGLDVRFIALIQAKMALLTLLRGEDSALQDFPSDLVFWGNRKEWIFPAPLFAQFARTKFREECSACNVFAAREKEGVAAELGVGSIAGEGAHQARITK